MKLKVGEKCQGCGHEVTEKESSSDHGHYCAFCGWAPIRVKEEKREEASVPQ